MQLLDLLKDVLAVQSRMEVLTLLKWESKGDH
jgi:hypothetical protein